MRLAEDCGFRWQRRFNRCFSSSKFHIIHTYESHHTKGEPWNSLMKAVTPSYRKVLKAIASAHQPHYPFPLKTLVCMLLYLRKCNHIL